jgi:hypothetical protein
VAKRPSWGRRWTPALAGTESPKEETDADLKRVRKSAHFLPASPQKTNPIPTYTQMKSIQMIVMECTLHLPSSITPSYHHPSPPLASVSINVVLSTGQFIGAACLSTVTEPLDAPFRTLRWCLPIVFHTCVHGPLASLFVVVVTPQLHMLELLEETSLVHEVDHVNLHFRSTAFFHFSLIEIVLGQRKSAHLHLFFRLMLFKIINHAQDVVQKLLLVEGLLRRAFGFLFVAAGFSFEN